MMNEKKDEPQLDRWVRHEAERREVAKTVKTVQRMHDLMFRKSDDDSRRVVDAD